MWCATKICPGTKSLRRRPEFRLSKLAPSDIKTATKVKHCLMHRILQTTKISQSISVQRRMQMEPWKRLLLLHTHPCNVWQEGMKMSTQYILHTHALRYNIYTIHICDIFLYMRMDSKIMFSTREREHSPVKRFSFIISKPQNHVNSIVTLHWCYVTGKHRLAPQNPFNCRQRYCKYKRNWVRFMYLITRSYIWITF